MGTAKTQQIPTGFVRADLQLTPNWSASVNISLTTPAHCLYILPIDKPPSNDDTCQPNCKQTHSRDTELSNNLVGALSNLVLFICVRIELNLINRSVCNERNLPQQGRKIVIGALNTTAVTLGFTRCVSDSIVCDSINRPGDLDLWLLNKFTGYPCDLWWPFRSRVRSRHATDRRTDKHALPIIS